eukprot:6212157-Pleurochrysis_carterae.AAC.4
MYIRAGRCVVVCMPDYRSKLVYVCFASWRSRGVMKDGTHRNMEDVQVVAKCRLSRANHYKCAMGACTKCVHVQKPAHPHATRVIAQMKSHVRRQMGATGTLAHVHAHMSTLRCQRGALPPTRTSNQQGKRFLVYGRNELDCAIKHLAEMNLTVQSSTTEAPRTSSFRSIQVHTRKPRTSARNGCMHQMRTRAETCSSARYEGDRSDKVTCA